MGLNGVKYPVYVNKLLMQCFIYSLFIIMLKSTSVLVKEWEKIGSADSDVSLWINNLREVEPWVGACVLMPSDWKRQNSIKKQEVQNVPFPFFYFSPENNCWLWIYAFYHYVAQNVNKNGTSISTTVLLHHCQFSMDQMRVVLCLFQISEAEYLQIPHIRLHIKQICACIFLQKFHTRHRDLKPAFLFSVKVVDGSQISIRNIPNLWNNRCLFLRFALCWYCRNETVK